jgi:N-acetylmuramoyl-L-alanine amidase
MGVRLQPISCGKSGGRARSALAALLLFEGASCGEPEPLPRVRIAQPTALSTAATHATVEPRQGSAAAASLEVVGDAELAGWARAAVGHERTSATLEQISLYGEGDARSDRRLTGREARVVLRFDRVAIYRRAELPAGDGLPRRLVLDLDGVAIGPAVPPALTVGRGGLQRVRTFVLDRDRVRVSFDVAHTTAYRLFFLSEPFRVVMDFRDQTTAAAAGAQPWTIVLDPGHGGEQPGAKGPNGLKESHVALAIARRVRQALRRHAPGARVVMTRDEDRFVSLEERAAIANAIDADLFVSIHLNASHGSDDLGGLATFVLDTTDDQAALRLAARENDMDIEAVSKLQFILASLYRSEQVERSRALAADVQRSTLRAGRRMLPQLHDRGVKSALFYVLVGARMPAILVEGSFISRPEEAAALATDAYRQALADGIAEGIVHHLERAR